MRLALGHVHFGAAAPDHDEPIETVRLLERLATRGGWFVPVSTLLDHLRSVGLGSPIGALDRRAIELRWLRHAICRGAGD